MKISQIESSLREWPEYLSHNAKKEYMVVMAGFKQSLEKNSECLCYTTQQCGNRKWIV